MYKGTYLEYMMGKAIDPAAMLERLKRETIDAMDYEPTEVGAGTGVSFLLSLASYDNPMQLPLASTYDEVMRRLSLLLYHLHAQLSMSEFSWPACCATCTAQSPTAEEEEEYPDFFEGICEAEMSNQPPDLMDLDKLKEQVTEATALATSSPADVLPAVQLFEGIRDSIEQMPSQVRFSVGNLANNLTEAIQKGLSQDLFKIQQSCVPRLTQAEAASHDEATDDQEENNANWSYPDMTHWDTWTAGDWLRMEGWKRKVLAAAACDLETMSLAINALQGVRENIGKLGLARQVQVAMWATELSDQLCGTLERGLAEICAGNVNTRRGRAIIKDMLEPEPEEPDGDVPD